MLSQLKDAEADALTGGRVDSNWQGSVLWCVCGAEQTKPASSRLGCGLTATLCSPTGSCKGHKTSPHSLAVAG